MGKATARIAIQAFIFAGILFLPFVTSSYHTQFATKALIMASLTVALNLAAGFGGLVSLCHAAFYGLGGYTLALSSAQYEPTPIWTTLLLALAVSAAAAFAIGALSLRTRGVYFIMVTLAFGEMLFSYVHDSAAAGGSDGLFIYNKPSVAAFGWKADLDNIRVFYYAVAIAFAFTCAAVWQVVRSPLGRALQAARDNERRARSVGFPVFRVRLIAFMISGTLAGLAGYFGAAQYGFVAPEMLSWHLSATILVMAVLGGMETPLAPALGAVVLLGMEEVLRTWTEHWRLAEGIGIIILVTAFPGGLRHLQGILIEDASKLRSRAAAETENA